MWLIKNEGRRLLRHRVDQCGGRHAFSLLAEIGKNQVQAILDEPDHSINHNTLRKLCDSCEGFTEGVHYESLQDADGCRIRLARDRIPAMILTRHDQRAIQNLYLALWNNPEFIELRPVLDSPERFNAWFRVWGNVTEEMPCEQYFVYRTFRDKVIAFLFGERQFRDSRRPFDIFAIWYLVGVANTFYEDSPVGLDREDEKALPLGEREAASKLMIRLLEELRQERSIAFITFEIEAAALSRPDSLARLLFRVYSRAEEDVRQLFAADPFLKDARFYVLDFPYVVPVEGSGPGEVSLARHVLVCCPLRQTLREDFKSGAVPASLVQDLLASLYPMYWNYYDHDSLTRARTKEATETAETAFFEEYIRQDVTIPVVTLRDYIKSGYGASSALNGAANTPSTHS